MENRDSISHSKGLFLMTLEFIGSFFLISFVVVLLIGFFDNSFFEYIGNAIEKALWDLFWWIVRICQPIGAFIFAGVLLFRILPDLYDSIMNDIRDERAANIINAFEQMPPPLLGTTQNNISNAPPIDEIQPVITRSRGVNVIHDETTPTGTFEFGNTKIKAKPGTEDFKREWETSDENKAIQKRLIEIDKEIEKESQKKLKYAFRNTMQFSDDEND